MCPCGHVDSIKINNRYTHESVDGVRALWAHLARDARHVHAPLHAQLPDEDAQRHEKGRPFSSVSTITKLI